MSKKIFVTGGSGCIGHYVLDELVAQHSDCHIYVLVRDSNKLHIKFRQCSSITVLEGSLEDIHVFKDLLEQIDYLIHIATNWNGIGGTTLINIDKTKELFDLCNSDQLKKVIYFSTASILGKGNKPIIEAKLYGSSYVKTKYIAHQMLTDLSIYDKIVTVFPTLVFGGGHDNYPKSHITDGIKSSLKYMKILKYIYLDGKFHFLHGQDIAKVCVHLLFNSTSKNEFVLGQHDVSVKQALQSICKVFKIRQPFRFKISMVFIKVLSTLFRIKIGPWEKHCMENPYMVFDTVNPESFNLKSAYPSLDSILMSAK